ncbi:nucleoside-diphosphate kinase [Solwaraspora sp. WMMD937]|uniref:nucleoside-diphosphate kinase n=1 Tax=Solwaraspora sp. WMMD937 TaxID=3016090 RepID=UPI00249A7E70|nr:nucleoside-diphosphate kinase [Solwaraspora sp. WMMD937]WFE22501.1 nucleoside-diphosphate kinase [Solwaraspora sp. WMMD937]
MSEAVDWERTVFMLLAPDALARHLGGQIVDRVVDQGFQPMAWRVLWHRPANLDAFHERNITQVWKAYLYRLVDQLFDFGPTVALLVRDVRPDPRHPSHARLRLAKGASDPADASPGTIRADLGSINVMLALMHSSDTPADSQRESAVFTDGQFGVGSGVGGRGGYDGGDPADLRTLLDLLSRSAPAERRGYPQVLAGLRARVLALAWPGLSDSARRGAADLLAGDLSGLAAAGAGEKAAGLLAGGHPLAPILTAEFTPDQPGPDPARVQELLAVHGARLDPWERLVLATSRRFAPRR